MKKIAIAVVLLIVLACPLACSTGGNGGYGSSTGWHDRSSLDEQRFEREKATASNPGNP